MNTLTAIPDEVVETIAMVVRLDLDVAELYDSVLPQITDPPLRTRIEQVKERHELRSRELAECIVGAVSQPLLGPGMRALYTPGSIVAADLSDTRQILKALAAAERELLASLERAADVAACDPKLAAQLDAAQADTRQQCQWITERLAA